MKKTAIFLCFLVYFSFDGAYSPVNVLKIETAEAATKAQWRYAKRACRKKYGKRLVRTVINRRGRITCRYRTSSRRVNVNSTYDQIIKLCRKQYKGNVSINAYKKYGKWHCTWRE